jgi:protein TonB
MAVVNRSEALQNAQQHVSRGELPAAAAIYRQVIESDPFDFATINTLGDLYLKAGRPTDAIAEFSRIAEGYFQTGFDVNAAYVLKKILELDPFNATVQMKLGDIYQRQSMNEKACESFLAAEVAFTRAGRLDAALTARTRAMALKPPAAMVTAPLQSEPQSGLPSQSLRSQESYEQARSTEGPQQPSQATYSAPSTDDSFVIQQLSKAEMLVGFGDVSRAVNLLQDALRQRPDNISIRIKLKDIYLRSAMMEKAGEECFKIARLFSSQGDAERARDYAVRARRLTQSVEAASDPTIENSDGINVEPSHSMLVEEPPAPPVVEEPALPIVEEPARPASNIQDAAKISPPDSQNRIRSQPPPRKPLIPTDIGERKPSTAFVPIADASSMTQSTRIAVRSTALTTMRSNVPAILSPRPVVRRGRPRWIYATAIAGTCLAVLAFAVVRELPAYEASLDREYEELARSNPLPPPTLILEATQQSEPPQEQMEVVALDQPGTPQPSQDATRPQQIQPRVTIQPGTRTPPVSASQQTAPSKRLPPSPPMVAPGLIGQGIPERTPSGVSSSLPRTIGTSEPPPPPVQHSSYVRGEAILKVQPEYPAIARQAAQSGTVTVEVSINEKGDVVAARAVGGPQLLRESSVSASRRWKFRPSLRDGKPVSSTTTIVFNFKR